jgi:hypothetical protein
MLDTVDDWPNGMYCFFCKTLWPVGKGMTLLWIPGVALPVQLTYSAVEVFTYNKMEFIVKTVRMTREGGTSGFRLVASLEGSLSTCSTAWQSTCCDR